LLAELDTEFPLEFCATTVKLYDVPFTNPLIVTGLEDPEAVIFPGEDVTIYDVTAVFVGAVKEIKAFEVDL
jgi:hypothetical protein